MRLLHTIILVKMVVFLHMATTILWCFPWDFSSHIMCVYCTLYEFLVSFIQLSGWAVPLDRYPPLRRRPLLNGQTDQVYIHSYMYMCVFIIISMWGLHHKDRKTCIREEEVEEGEGMSAYLAVY